MANSAEWFSRMGPEAAKVCEVLSRNTSHLMGLLIELSDLRDLAHDPLGIEFCPTDVKSLVKEASNMGLSLTRSKEIKFMVSVATDCPAVISVDKLKILRALENLFSNAVKFSDRGTTIRFTVESGGNHILFIVTDEGRGIPAAEKHMLFQEFGKTSTRPTEGESSTGLGLSIVREIAQLHGGRAEVNSTAGRGSTFTLRIPCGEMN